MCNHSEAEIWINTEASSLSAAALETHIDLEFELTKIGVAVVKFTSPLIAS